MYAQRGIILPRPYATVQIELCGVEASNSRNVRNHAHEDERFVGDTLSAGRITNCLLRVAVRDPDVLYELLVCSQKFLPPWRYLVSMAQSHARRNRLEERDRTHRPHSGSDAFRLGRIIRSEADPFDIDLTTQSGNTSPLHPTLKGLIFHIPNPRGNI